MARQRTLPEHVATETVGTEPAETPAEPVAGSKKKTSNGEASSLRRETEGSSVSAMGGDNTAKRVGSQGKKSRKKGQQRGNDSERRRPSANGLIRQSLDDQGDVINGSNVRSSSSTVRCSDNISDSNRRSSQQRSSIAVDSTSRMADLTVHIQPESSDESSVDDGDNEIDLRAKTGKELYKQAECSGSGDSDSSQCAVQASFGLFDPREEDKEAIGCLLRQSLLQFDLKFSPSVLQQLAATIAEQGNVGSILKTVDDEDSEEEEALQQVSQECSSDDSRTTDGENKSRNSRSASVNSAAAVVAGGQLTNKSVYDGARGLEARQEKGESGTVVGFLTLLSFQQYPDVVAPFKKAILRLAGEHAPVEQKTALERLFLTPAPKIEKRSLHSKSSSSSNEASTKPAAQRSDVDDLAVNCGWLLKERLSNTPPQLIPQMYDSLLDDISWSLSTEEMDEAERPFYAYSYVCGLTKVYKEGDGHSSSRAFKRHKTCKALPFDAIFPHPEDELLLGFATQSFAWPTGRSVRISLETGRMKTASPSGACGSEKTTPATRICCCPEYLLFFALPFDQFRCCKDAIAARAKEG